MKRRRRGPKPYMSDREARDWFDHWRRVKAREAAERAVPCRLCRHWRPTDSYARICQVRGIATEAGDSCERGERPPAMATAVGALPHISIKSDVDESQSNRLLTAEESPTVQPRATVYRPTLCENPEESGNFTSRLA